MGPFDQLLTQPSGSNVAPETLEMLGRQASQMFQSQGVPLNQAVSQVLANHPELSNEHIKRIVEFANTVTFQEMFTNSADKNVHFDVADPGVILRDLKDGGSPAHDGKTLANADYRQTPSSGPNGEVESALTQQFLGQHTPNVDGQMKVASAHVDHEMHANPVDDAWDTRTRLLASREKLVESYESMDLMRKQAHEDLFNQIKLQVMDPDGAGLGGVLSVLEKVAEQEILEVLLPPMIERLKDQGFQSDYLNRSLEKRAGAVVNLEHPIIVALDAMLKLASEQVTCGRAIADIDKHITDVEAVFKKQAGALTTSVKKAINPSGHVPSGIRQRFPRG